MAFGTTFIKICPYYCSECQEEFKDLEQLIEHQKKGCEECG